MPYNTKFWDQLVLQSYKILLKRKPDSALIHTNLGLAYVRMKKDNKAVRSFQRAIKCDKAYAEAYYHLGMTYKRMGKIEEALRSFLHYSRLNKKDKYKNPFVNELVEGLELEKLEKPQQP